MRLYEQSTALKRGPSSQSTCFRLTIERNRMHRVELVFAAATIRTDILCILEEKDATINLSVEGVSTPWQMDGQCV